MNFRPPSLKVSIQYRCFSTSIRWPTIVWFSKITYLRVQYFLRLSITCSFSLKAREESMPSGHSKCRKSQESHALK